MKIIKLEISNKLSKRFKVTLSDGKTYDFGYEDSDGKPGLTYIDGASLETRNNYLKRHMANNTENNLINNLIPSPALFSAYLLWYGRNLKHNIEYLNQLLVQKYK